MRIPMEFSTQCRPLPLACAFSAQTWLSCSQSQGITALGMGACRTPLLLPVLACGPPPPHPPAQAALMDNRQSYPGQGSLGASTKIPSTPNELTHSLCLSKFLVS